MRSLDLSWKQAGLCWDTDQAIWFPPGDDPDVPEQAARLCNQCPVQTDCLDYAVSIRPSGGIWAGHTPKGIRKERRRRQHQTRKTRQEGVA